MKIKTVLVLDLKLIFLETNLAKLRAILTTFVSWCPLIGLKDYQSKTPTSKDLSPLTDNMYLFLLKTKLFFLKTLNNVVSLIVTKSLFISKNAALYRWKNTLATFTLLLIVIVTDIRSKISVCVPIEMVCKPSMLTPIKHIYIYIFWKLIGYRSYVRFCPDQVHHNKHHQQIFAITMLHNFNFMWEHVYVNT